MISGTQRDQRKNVNDVSASCDNDKAREMREGTELLISHCCSETRPREIFLNAKQSGELIRRKIEREGGEGLKESTTTTKIIKLILEFGCVFIFFGCLSLGLNSTVQ